MLQFQGTFRWCCIHMGKINYNGNILQEVFWQGPSQQNKTIHTASLYHVHINSSLSDSFIYLFAQQHDGKLRSLWWSVPKLHWEGFAQIFLQGGFWLSLWVDYISSGKLPGVWTLLCYCMHLASNVDMMYLPTDAQWPMWSWLPSGPEPCCPPDSIKWYQLRLFHASHSVSNFVGRFGSGRFVSFECRSRAGRASFTRYWAEFWPYPGKFSIKPTTTQRCRSETEKNILENLFSPVFSQLKRYHPSRNLKFNNLGISQSLKFCILLEKKILPICLKLNFTPNTLGWYGLRILRGKTWFAQTGPLSRERESWKSRNSYVFVRN